MTLMEQFIETEQSLLRGAGYSGVSWMGVAFRWIPGAKRDGCELKRRGHYGRIEYRRVNGKILTREEAITEVEMPLSLRRAIRDIESLRTCGICHITEMGEDLEHWQRVIFFKPSGFARGYMGETELKFEHVWLDLCDRCVAAIAAGKIKPGAGDQA